MKHLKSFNESVPLPLYINQDKHIQDIKDVLQDVIDEWGIVNISSRELTREEGFFYNIKSIGYPYCSIQIGSCGLNYNNKFIKVNREFESSLRRLSSLGYRIIHSNSFVKLAGSTWTRPFMDMSNSYIINYSEV